jgi:hypothetical protein
LRALGFDFLRWLQDDANEPIWKSQGIVLQQRGADHWVVSMLGIPYDDEGRSLRPPAAGQLVEFDFHDGKAVPMRR